MNITRMGIGTSARPERGCSAWLLLLVAAFLTAACDARQPRLNHFIVPVDYTGPIALVSDPSFVSSGRQEEARYVHLVPDSGVVCVPDDSMVRPTIRLTAEYSDGTPIYSFFRDLPPPPTPASPRIKIVGSWGGGTEHSYVHWLGVGTEAEVKRLENEFFGHGIEMRLPAGVSIDESDNEDFSQFAPYCAGIDTARESALPDPLAAGWQGQPVCALVHEDVAMRILRCDFPPGVGHERHYHPPHFGFALSGGRMRLIDESGVREIDLETGSSYTSDGVDWHEVLNVGETTVSYLIIERRPESPQEELVIMSSDKKISYVELPAEDLDAAEKFYGGTFGWTFTDYGPEYRSFSDGEINGGFYKSEQRSRRAEGAALIVLYAADLEATREAVVNNGGTIHEEIFSFPGGRRFHFLDPNGNELAIWSDK